MLKVLIVDDEIIVRVGLKSCIQWQSYGYEVVAMAEDGETALLCMERYRPDIVFTDIKMPGMDGLQFLKKARESYRDARFIMLSCLNDIEYVKQAIKLGAEDYILKLSLKQDVLIELLLKLKADIETRLCAAPQAPAHAFGRRLYDREQLYKRLLIPRLPREQHTELFGKLSIPELPDCRSIVGCFYIDDYAAHLPVAKSDSANMVKTAIVNILEDFTGKYPYAEGVEINPGEFLAFIRYQASMDFYGDIQARPGSLENALKRHLNLSGSVGFSRPFDDSFDLAKRYEEAKKNATRQFFFGQEACGGYEAERADSLDTGAIRDLGDALIQAVKAQDKRRACREIDDWVAQLKARPCEDAVAVRVLCIEAWASLVRYLREIVDRDAQPPDLNENPAMRLMELDNLEAIGAYLKKKVGAIIDSILQGRRVKPEIVKLKQYVMDHIDENIRLEQAAQICGISQTYFSSLFKKECGENFSSYLNRMKMEKAEELIKVQNMRSSEAAYRVGIMDESYFSKLFRKYIGHSPSELRRMGESSSSFLST